MNRKVEDLGDFIQAFERKKEKERVISPPTHLQKESYYLYYHGIPKKSKKEKIKELRLGIICMGIIFFLIAYISNSMVDPPPTPEQVFKGEPKSSDNFIFWLIFLPIAVILILLYIERKRRIEKGLDYEDHCRCCKCREAEEARRRDDSMNPASVSFPISLRD